MYPITAQQAWLDLSVLRIEEVEMYGRGRATQLGLRMMQDEKPPYCIYHTCLLTYENCKQAHTMSLPAHII